MSIEEKYDEIRQLIIIGKEKGYLLYDEVNEALPADLTSSDELDDLFGVLGNAGVAGRRLRAEVPGNTAPRPPERRARDDADNFGSPSCYRQDQRPRPHVSAGDGYRAAAHTRRRGRNRQADRARQAVRHQGRSPAHRLSRGSSSRWVKSYEAASARSASSSCSRTRS